MGVLMLYRLWPWATTATSTTGPAASTAGASDGVELPAFEAHWRPFMEGAARPGSPNPDAARHAALVAFAREVAGS
jgi:hypothetical protein